MSHRGGSMPGKTEVGTQSFSLDEGSYKKEWKRKIANE